MWKSAMAALTAAAMFGPCLAQSQSSEFDEGMQTLWEVLWHQSGTPTRLVRWEQDINVRIFGVHLAAHKAWALQALRDVANEAGVKVIDVSGQPDAAQVANVSIEITPNNMLEDVQPCVTYLNFRTETKIDSAAMQVRDRDAWRCAYHEAMHVMGVRGHPAGKTVLSYFPVKVDGLLPLDKVMLHAWYSPKMRGGMTPFEAMPVLGEELAKTMPDPDQALQDRDRFLAQINLVPGDILCLDWEWYGQDVSDAQARDYKDAWLDHVRSQAPGHRTVLYCDRNNWLNVDTDSQCGDGLWIADYTTAGQPRIKHPWTFHQYTDSPQDQNVANFPGVAELRSWAGAPHLAGDLPN